jgi:DNA-directed RNA polymerase specialized sigma24 family protein
MEIRSSRTQWAPTPEAFQALLSSLDADQERAARRYEELRHKLIVFFSGRACPDADDRADETLDRLTRRLEEGQGITHIGRFAYGIARLVLAEWIRRERTRRRALREVRFAAAPYTSPFDEEAGVECVRRCARRLGPADRQLILAYYESAGSEGQQERKALAERFGLRPDALRVRAYRIRRALEACTRQCLEGRP